jgi:hypothetical protein
MTLHIIEPVKIPDQRIDRVIGQAIEKYILLIKITGGIRAINLFGCIINNTGTSPSLGSLLLSKCLHGRQQQKQQEEVSEKNHGQK